MNKKSVLTVMCSCACIDDPIFFCLCNAMIDERDALQEDQETLIQYNFISLPLSFFFKIFILVITCACIFFCEQTDTLHVVLSLGSPTS